MTYSNNLGSVHRLIVKHFIGEIPKGMCVNHIDGNKLNNHILNLEIVTYSQNSKHSYRLGLQKPGVGEKNNMSKLSEADCEKLCQRLLEGKDNETIAKEFGLHSRYVSLIRHGKRWKHLYEKFGGFPKSQKYDPRIEKYNKFLELQDNHTNKDIAKILEVDPSTISLWRRGLSRGHNKCNDYRKLQSGN